MLHSVCFSRVEHKNKSITHTKMENLKKHFVLMTLAVMAFQLSLLHLPMASASPTGTAGEVVINEVAWAGTADNWRDEWIELHNITNREIDLSGWYIEDDRDRVYLIEEGAIPARGYFVIADKSDSLSNVEIDAVITLSLVDDGNSLILKDPEGKTIDVVNSSAGAWFAGDSSTRATMERINPSLSGDLADNWASAVSGNGAKGNGGCDILGTPGGVNSTYDGGGPEVSMGKDGSIVYSGNFVSFPVEIDEVSDLYAYGFEINYDSDVLNFVDATESDFLKEQGVDTAFYAALLNGEEGSLIVGNARLLNPPVGKNGTGKLFDLKFEILTAEEDGTAVVFGAGSFIADSEGDMPAKLVGLDLPLSEDGTGGVAPVTNLQASEGEDRYSIKMSWLCSDADLYVIEKKMHDGEFLKVGEVEDCTFTDYQNIIPHLSYQYRVIPAKNGMFGEAGLVQGVDSRGLKGDNNRSDSVDGRDIENLARAFGSQYGDPEYNPLADTNFDGMIDGSDLIDIGLNFGLTY